MHLERKIGESLGNFIKVRENKISLLLLSVLSQNIIKTKHNMFSEFLATFLNVYGIHTVITRRLNNGVVHHNNY